MGRSLKTGKFIALHQYASHGSHMLAQAQYRMHQTQWRNIYEIQNKICKILNVGKEGTNDKNYAILSKH